MSKVTSTAVYARDLRIECRNKAFLGASYDKCVKKVGEDGEIIVGYFLKECEVEE